MRSKLIFTAFALALQVTTAQAAVTEYDYHKNAEWQLIEQFVDDRFDACIARRSAFDGEQRFSIGRRITGDDFVFVEGMQNFVAADEGQAKGKVYINGVTGYDFSDQTVLENPVFPGTKYITIYLADGFIDNLASANSITVELSKGSSKHGLKGSKDIISRFNQCMESGLNREMAPPPAQLAAPTGWTAGMSEQGQGGRYIAIELPPFAGAAFGQKLFFAYAENGQGRIDIRLRDSMEGIARKIDLASASAKRIAASVSMANQPAFSSMVAYEGTAIDVIDVLPADIAKLSLAGPVTIQSLEAATKSRVDLTFTAQAAMGAASMQGSAGPAQLTLESLVGKYWVRGRNPDGKSYTGTADTMIENGALRISWVWRNQKTDTAQGNLFADVLTAVVTGLPDPAVYKIGKDGVWRGTWSKGQGLEWMVPQR